jgi:hypothetical protein
MKIRLILISMLFLCSCSSSESVSANLASATKTSRDPVACNGNLAKSYSDGSSIASVKWNEELSPTVEDGSSSLDSPDKRPQGLVLTSDAPATGNTRFLIRADKKPRGGLSLGESVYADSISTRFLCSTYEVETSRGTSLMPVLITGGRSVTYPGKDKSVGKADTFGTRVLSRKCRSGRIVRLEGIDVLFVFHTDPPWCMARNGKIEVEINKNVWSDNKKPKYTPLTLKARKKLAHLKRAIRLGPVPSDLELRTESEVFW